MLRLVWPRLIASKAVSVRILALLALLLLGGVVLSCGGRSNLGSQPFPNIAGSWEFVAVSNDGAMTGIEVALKEGQVLIDGLEQPDGQITANSSQIEFLSLGAVAPNVTVTGFGGNCQPITSAVSLGPGSVTTLGSPISFTFTENGNVFNVAGMLSGDGTMLLNGTYTAQAGNTCADTGGTIMGYTVPKLSGTYIGQMCSLGSNGCQSFTDTVVSATLSESSSGVATLSLVLTGTDNTTFTMTGPVMGNAFSVQGTFQGQLLTYDGYFEQVSKKGSTVAGLYLVNATNVAQPAYAGTLTVLPQM